MNFNLAGAVYLHSLASPDALAVACDGAALTYAQLAARSMRLAQALQDSSDWNHEGAASRRVGIFASRSLDACVAMIGTCWAGATYVPISLSSPEDRILEIMRNCNLDAIVADARGMRLLSRTILEACPPTVIVPDTSSLPAAPPDWVNITSITSKVSVVSAPAPMSASDTAYIVFTSGTTGAPKGVMISAGAARHYVEAASKFLALTRNDRALETCELSFDASVHNMFSTWEAGASLHILPATQVLSAVKFARTSRLTVWNSVPSLVGMLRQLGVLRPNALPDLRLAVFGGEQLSAGIVDAWRIAAPSSDVKNFYGPTEATVYCLCQTIDGSVPLTPGRDVMSIGVALDGNEAFVIDESGSLLHDGQVGELAIAGPQLADCYIGAPELTARKFPTINGKRLYLTGDLAMRDASGIFHCLGRKDNQVKVLGHRIELEEIEAHLRVVTGVDLVGAVAWPVVDGTARGVVAFVGAESLDSLHIREALAARLPAYMLPGRVLNLTSMPLNHNGKVDRGALVDMLRREAA
jgi:amino acid adenylation domain-containing protein